MKLGLRCSCWFDFCLRHWVGYMNGHSPQSRSRSPPKGSQACGSDELAQNWNLALLCVADVLCFLLFCVWMLFHGQVRCGYSAGDLLESSKFQMGYAFDDLICMPGHIDFGVHEVELLSRFTRSISLKTPIVSSPMDTVTEKAMAIAMALEGGIGTIHSKMTIERQVAEVRSVKRYEQGFISNPQCIGAEMTCGELMKLQQKCGFSGFPVTENGQMKSKLLGLVTKRDSDFFPSESTRIEDTWQRS